MVAEAKKIPSLQLPFVEQDRKGDYVVNSTWYRYLFNFKQEVLTSFSASPGLLVSLSGGAIASRELQAGSTKINITNGDGASGDPTIDVNQANLSIANTQITGATISNGASVSGTNTGDQTITLTGDVTGSGTGSFATTIANNAVITAKILDANVTFAKIQNVAASSLLGNATAGATAPTNIGLNSTLSFTGSNLQRAALTGDVTATAGSNATTIANDAVTTVKILNANVTYAKIQNVTNARLLGNNSGGAAAPSEISLNSTLSFSGSTLQREALTGDVTASAGSNSTTIANNAVTTAKILDDNVTFAKIQNITDARLLGRSAGSSGDMQEITVGAGLSLAAGALTATGGGGGSGTVTSVDMTVPSVLAVSGNPITTSGTLAVTLATQSANNVFAGPTSGAAATPTFRALAAADMPAGSIVQVVQGTLTATATISSNVFADTGLTASITPSKNTNKILVTVSMSCGGPTSELLYFKLLRDATSIFIGDAAGSRTQATAGAVLSVATAEQQVSFSYLDSPATTSSTTYKVQWRESSGASAAYLGRSSTDTNAATFIRTANSIILMEVVA